MDLTTNYLGQELKNPIIVGSCELTSNIEDIKRLEKAGAGAVVLKTLLNDEMDLEDYQIHCANKHKFPDSLNYINTYVSEGSLQKYLDLISELKKEVSIPIFSSINCHPKEDWVEFARKAELAGADGTELNVMMLPCKFERSGKENEQYYFKVAEKARKVLKKPIALKMSSYSAGLARLVQDLSWTKDLDAFVFFNRFYKPDIDIENLTLKTKNNLSAPADITDSLRWILLLSRMVKTPMIGNTGIHSGEDVIKHLLAGASGVQVVSALYRNDISIVEEMISELKSWMERKNFNSLEDFRGLMHDKLIERKTIENSHTF